MTIQNPGQLQALAASLQALQSYFGQLTSQLKLSDSVARASLAQAVHQASQLQSQLSVALSEVRFKDQHIATLQNEIQRQKFRSEGLEFQLKQKNRNLLILQNKLRAEQDQPRRKAQFQKEKGLHEMQKAGLQSKIRKFQLRLQESQNLIALKDETIAQLEERIEVERRRLRDVAVSRSKTDGEGRQALDRRVSLLQEQAQRIRVKLQKLRLVVEEKNCAINSLIRARDELQRQNDCLVKERSLLRQFLRRRAGQAGRG